MSATVLVTGGAGFIGSHTVDALLAGGSAVRVLDNFSSGTRENLAHVAAEVEVLEGDVRDVALVERAVAGCDAVVHLAAVASVQASYEMAEDANCGNVGGTVKVLRAAGDAGLARLVFASSCAVYGDPPEVPVGERTPPSPLSPYAVSKLAGEGYCRTLPAAGGLDTVALRFFNVYGPRQDPASDYAGVIGAFVGRAVAGLPCRVDGDGAQTRDFVYVPDAVGALLAALAAHGRLGGEVVNIGTGVETSVLDIVAALGHAAGRDLEIERAPARAGDVRRSCARNERARRRLGWAPAVGFADGLVATYRDHVAAHG